MALVHALIIGNDIQLHKLVNDILEITFSDIKIDRTTSVEGFFSRIKSAKVKYDLIIFDCQNDKRSDEDVISRLRQSYPGLLPRMVLLLENSTEKPDDSILQSIPSVMKPFSLDGFGILVKKIVYGK